MQLQFGRNVGIESILSRLDEFQSLNDFGRLFSFFVIGGIVSYRRIFK